MLNEIFLKFLKSKNGVGNNNKRCVVIGWQLDGWRIVKTKAMGEDNMSTSQSVYLYDSTSI